MVEAIYGYSTNIIIPNGYQVGYGVGADRTVLLRWPNTQADPIIKVSDWFADPSGEVAQGTGDDPLIRKPFRFAELREEVQRALKRPPDGVRENIVPLKNRRR